MPTARHGPPATPASTLAISPIASAWSSSMWAAAPASIAATAAVSSAPAKERGRGEIDDAPEPGDEVRSRRLEPHEREVLEVGVEHRSGLSPQVSLARRITVRDRHEAPLHADPGAATGVALRLRGPDEQKRRPVIPPNILCMRRELAR